MPKVISRLILVVIVTLSPGVTRADDWPAPEPRSFRARGFGFVAEIFPPKSRQNIGQRPYCYFYEMGYPGTSWKIDPKLRWHGTLANAAMPYEAIVSMDGRLVTLNDWHRVGHEHAVVIYDHRGKLVKSYALDQLLPQIDMGKFPESVSSRWWNKGARYYFMSTPARLYIVLTWGHVLEFSLTDGKFRYGPERDFKALVKRDGNAVTEVWGTSLRFSSVTDVVRARVTGGAAP